MKCPKCKSDSLQQSGQFDLTMVDANEAHHDWECNKCGCLFQIIYHPTETRIVGQGEPAYED